MRKWNDGKGFLTDFVTCIVVFGMAGGWHLLYGTRSVINTVFYDKSVTGMAFPVCLKPFAGMNHLLIINAALWYLLCH